MMNIMKIYIRKVLALGLPEAYHERAQERMSGRQRPLDHRQEHQPRPRRKGIFSQYFNKKDIKRIENQVGVYSLPKKCFLSFGYLS